MAVLDGEAALPDLRRFHPLTPSSTYLPPIGDSVMGGRCWGPGIRGERPKDFPLILRSPTASFSNGAPVLRLGAE